MSIVDLRASDPSADGMPSGTQLPWGTFAFTLEGVQAGASTTVMVFLPEESEPTDTYLRYGPEPGRTDDHWYDFSWDLETGAQVAGRDRVVLHFVDGGRGDDDLVADGRIVDAGGAAQAENQSPDPSMTWKYGRYAPLTVHLTSTSTDPDGTITQTKWLTPEGRQVMGTELTWNAPGGPGGTVRRFVLAVFDGTTWSTREIDIAVPPVMRLQCENRVTEGTHAVDFDGTSNYWPVYGWSTSVGSNQRFGDYDEASVWYEWDPGNGQPRITGSINNIHQNDFDAAYQYGERPEDPSHYTATLHAGAYVTGTTQKVELATCETVVQFPIPVYDLFGTLKITRESHYGPGDSEDQQTTDEELTATLVVAMRTDPESPSDFINVSSSYQVDRVHTASRENSGDCSPWRTITKSSGAFFFSVPGDPPPTDPNEGVPAIWGFEDRAKGMVVISNVEWYPIHVDEVCAFINLPTEKETPDAWFCGSDYFGSPGLGIEGYIFDQPSGPDQVTIDCSYEGPAFLYDTQKITVTGTLTIVGR